MSALNIQDHFLNKLDVNVLLEKYGSPLYVYSEDILRERLREVRGLVDEPWFGANISIKANGNPELLKIVREEGCNGDAVSPGEIFLLEKAGFDPAQIIFVSNNASPEEMQYALDRGVLVSVDSLSQLETLGRLNKGGRVCLRFNPGAGAGHHEKVITAGKKTKFGIQNNMIAQAKAIAHQYDMRIVGINQHIGSLFMDNKPYLDGVSALLDIAREFETLEFVDFGGGFGIPYKRYHGEAPMDLAGLSQSLKTMVTQWMRANGREIRIKVEPGRYVFAECGALLGTVHAVKTSYDRRYIGTDIGFNVLLRSAMYDAYHEIALFRNSRLLKDGELTEATVVGNVCESGDILAKDRMLPAAREGDVVAVLDAGAYGYAMSSNYNQRLRPAEVLITADGSDRLIRRRDRFEDLLTGLV
jgi:diaminopimelate decarboxylase